MAGNGIVADAHDLGIEAGEPCQFGMERRHLGGSSGSPIQGMESEYHVLVAAIITEAEAVGPLADHCREFEIGRQGAHRQCRHQSSIWPKKYLIGRKQPGQIGAAKHSRPPLRRAGMCTAAMEILGNKPAGSGIEIVV